MKVTSVVMLNKVSPTLGCHKGTLPTESLQSTEDSFFARLVSTRSTADSVSKNLEVWPMGRVG